ncbi:hypothetical protein NDA10_001989 [Ustilago hordei]|uniref:PH domain-containing protein n=1 Tax=Ustilago hordei TaxID=120017 RepID=I2FT70_USTHO|nr:uncharacterized protein UHO2_06005 [Ustilago hordei]KAJ1043828.1 hypothetical protein NDA10_001989 [Ustilago hordei]KAJ1572427.1 hypothetical protein NDA12_000829 [Ustilago hordei]KAJ1576216.1 hypothetical protein NDA15_005660 [Ustilago hordei]CCF50113.1 uncharacterized protein UHOR_07098 [Ustilago hordei]SYW83384.1 uncharacterized protein UHO2_06005 [Ustilago hordei]
MVVVVASPQQHHLDHALEPLQPPLQFAEQSTPTRQASSSRAAQQSNNTTFTATTFTTTTFTNNTTSSSVRMPPSRPCCLKCQPILQHSNSTASVPTNHPAHSTRFVTRSNHATVRYYLGPTIVPASTAKALALAIIHDGLTDLPTSSAHDKSAFSPHPPEQAHDIAAADYASLPPVQSQPARPAPPLHTSTHPFSTCSPTQPPAHEQRQALSPPSSPSTLRKPRLVDSDPSSASVLSNASFASAQSIPPSALSDSEPAQRGRTIFDLDPSTATHSSSSPSRSVSPSKKRFALLNRSFPITAAASSNLHPPPSILKSNVQSERTTLRDARSAENLRLAALPQQRRTGSEGSKFSATAAATNGTLSQALPILELPLDQIEEAFNDSDTPHHVQSSSEPNSRPNYASEAQAMSPQPNTSHPDHQAPALQNERRDLNSSNDTTIIIRNGQQVGRDGGAPHLRHQSSFTSRSESYPAGPNHGASAHLQRQDLLHPAWEQSTNGVNGTHAANESLANGSATLADPLTAMETEDNQHSLTAPWRNIVPRGLPTKRSLTFSGEPSAARRSTNPATTHLPRAVDSHHRDFSRQSRMSRASTAGTFNTVGTEGSFGLSAGAPSTFARKFLAGGSFRSVPKRTDSIQNRNLHTQFGPTRTNSIRHPFSPSSPTSIRARKTASPFVVRRRRPTRSASHASMHRDPSPRISASGTEISLADTISSVHARGVPPGAVGTSTGGSKWVGESFQVGKRFWDVVNVRRAELQQSQPCSCGNHQSSTDSAHSPDADAQHSDQKWAEEHAAKVQHLKQSPDGVITLLAQEAQDISDHKASEAQAQAQAGTDHQHASAMDKATRSREHSSTEPSSQMRKDKSGSETPTRRKLSIDESLASIQAVHPDEATPLAIEARQGWSEIVSKMASLTGELSTGLKTRTFDRKSSPSSKLESKAADKSSSRLADDLPNKTPEQNGSLKAPADSDFKIRARSTSLVESDKSSTASQSVYASLHPSSHINGFAPRASSLASRMAPTMTRSDALSHPAPPASVEANNPELVHQLLRRKSDLGERPDVMSDAASDHAVAVRPVASPLRMTPTRELVSPNAMPLLEQGPFPIDSSPPNERLDPAPKASGFFKSVGLASSPARKKTVKFETGSTRTPLQGRFTASLFAGKAKDNATPFAEVLPTAPGNAEPKPPEEVLTRPQPNVIQAPLSTGNSTPISEGQSSEASIIASRSVIKKDRMLVKVAWTPHQDLPTDFDELQARKYSIREEEWREFIVVFRMGKLELYADSSLTSKLRGHGDRLKLRLTIPLSRGSTFVSLYSPIDRIFCLTFQPWKLYSAQHNERRIHLRRQGTDIVLFDCRARSAAADWMWELWRELGGLIPESLEIHVPSFGLKVKIPIPESMPVERAQSTMNTPGSQLSAEKGGLFALSSIGQSQEGGEGFKLINRDNVIAMTWKLFCGIPQWHDLMELSRQSGLRLELAWRRGTELDWVINERTVENEPCHWAVLCGALLRDYKHPSILELRAAAHYPTSVLVSPGQYMQEPPAVEGYLWRLRQVSGKPTRLYLTTYDGHLYVCRASRAFTPDRVLADKMKETLCLRVPKPSSSTQDKNNKGKAAALDSRSGFARALAKVVGNNTAARRDEDVETLRQNVMELISYAAETEEDLQAQIDAYQSFERRRQFEQIRGSDGFIDLKTIHTIKTVGKGPERCPGEDDVRRPVSKGMTSLISKGQGDSAAAQGDDKQSGFKDEQDTIVDIGGQEGLERAKNEAKEGAKDGAKESIDLQRARQIEITLTNGKSVRLEAFSATVAREWVECISDLVKYWRRRERADAIELMQASGIDMTELNKQLSGRKTMAHSFDGVEEQKLSPILGNVWNWCQIEGCRNIIRSGRLFHKKSSYSAFKARDYVLIAGRLLCFKLVRSVRTSRARQNNGIFHRRQETVIHLRDAYVYSGKLSEDMLKNGRSEPAQAVSGLFGGGSNSGKRHRVPRVYADGLFSVDDDEDCTFVIRYRPERVNTPADPSVGSLTTKKGKAAAQRSSSAAGRTETAGSSASVPALEDKRHKYIAMRARCKTERDLWVRCITYEIEKIVREDVEREKKLKNIGRVDYKDRK